MATSVDWGTKTIHVERNGLLLLQSTPTEIRQLDIDQFRLELKDLEDDSNGMAFERTHKHNTLVPVGGVILARVVEIINGYTVTFEDGQYAVNLVGANSNIADVTNVNQVSVRSANSAGLQNLSTLLSASYQGRVVVDVINGQSGTSIPLGTYGTPVNNMEDAIDIAETNGLRIFEFMNNTVIDSTFSGYTLTSTHPLIAVILDPSANISECSAKHITVTGDVDGIVSIERCGLLTTQNVSGVIDNSFFSNDVFLSGPTYVFQCFSQLSGIGNVDFHTTTHDLVVRDFHGSITISDMTSGTHSIGLVGGKLTIGSTCTGGTVYLREEPFEIIDDSGGLVTIIDQTSGVKVTRIDNLQKDVHGQIPRCIFINTELNTNGNGYQQSPFNNLSDAIDLAENQNLRTLIVMADIIFDRSVKNFDVQGIGLPEVDMNGFEMKNTSFLRCKLKGAFTSSIIAEECIILDTATLNGFYTRCSFSGTSVCANNSFVTLVDSISSIAGTGRPTISLSPTSPTNLAIRSQRGGLNITNCNNIDDNVTVEMMAGAVTLESSCTGGVVVLRGVGEHIDNSNGSIVVNQMIGPTKLIAKEVWEVDSTTLTTNNSVGHFLTKKLLKFKQYIALK